MPPSLWGSRHSNSTGASAAGGFRGLGGSGRSGLRPAPPGVTDAPPRMWINTGRPTQTISFATDPFPGWSAINDGYLADTENEGFATDHSLIVIASETETSLQQVPT